MQPPSHGHFYGYPPCCIDFFQQALAKKLKFKDFPLTQQQAAAHGFVPCEHHAEQILLGKIKIQDIILSTRRCQKPFPSQKIIKSERRQYSQLPSGIGRRTI
jgi:hypothetical protein